MKVVERRARIESADGLAVFVVHDEAEDIRSIMLGDVVEIPFPVVIDLERDCYEGWGLVRVAWWRIWLDPKVWKQYAQLLLGGERVRGAGRDVQQLGGDFVIAPGGRVSYSRPQRRDDRPPAGELIDQLEAAAADDRSG